RYQEPDAEKPKGTWLAYYQDYQDKASKQDHPGISRRYHYEDPRWPTLLTGISAEERASDGQRRAKRLSTRAYDAQRRSILSVRGEPPAQGSSTEDGARRGRAEDGARRSSAEGGARHGS